jgi:hypothetical protein
VAKAITSQGGGCQYANPVGPAAFHLDEEEKKCQANRGLIEMNEKKVWFEMAEEQKAKELAHLRGWRYRDRVA